MWARLHKIDKVRPQPNGGAIVIIEDERTAGNMQRVPSLSTLVAIARVLSGFRVLDARRKIDVIQEELRRQISAFLTESDAGRPAD